MTRINAESSGYNFASESVKWSPHDQKAMNTNIQHVFDNLISDSWFHYADPKSYKTPYKTIIAELTQAIQNWSSWIGKSQDPTLDGYLNQAIGYMQHIINALNNQTGENLGPVFTNLSNTVDNIYSHLGLPPAIVIGPA